MEVVLFFESKRRQYVSLRPYKVLCRNGKFYYTFQVITFSVPTTKNIITKTVMYDMIYCCYYIFGFDNVFEHANERK